MGRHWVHRSAIRAFSDETPGRCGGSHEGALAHFQIIPDRSLENTNVEQLARFIAGLYRPLPTRWDGRRLLPPDRAAWEILLEPGEATFYLTLPEEWSGVAQKELSAVWPKATIRRVKDPLEVLSPVETAQLELRHHFMFSLKADRRTTGMLPSLLETTKALEKGQQVLVQMIFDPAPPDWWQGAAAAYELFRSGKMPRRLRLDHKAIAILGLRAATSVVLEAISVVNEVITGKPLDPIPLDGADKAAALRERPVGHTVAEKLRSDAVDATIRIAVTGVKGKAEGKHLIRSVWFAFRTLDGENSFELVGGNTVRNWRLMRKRLPGLKVNRDYLGIKELGMLLLLPTGPLQEAFGLTSIEHREVEVPAILTKGGLFLGEVNYRSAKKQVFLPIDNLDELCLPHVVIGGMGTGKTRGFGANLAVEAVKKGFAAVVIDPARGEIGNEIEAVIPENKITRIKFGIQPVALDWREANHSERGRNRLANELIAFCEAATDEAGAQTVRYLRSAAKAVPTGRLSEVVRLFTDADYRLKIIGNMRTQERVVWESFGKLSEARQAQIGLPVLNRLDVIMGDDYLAECMEAEEGLDFVRLLEEPRCIIVDIPKDLLGGEAVDVLASLIATKLDLAMVLRKTAFPVFIIQDEPHQYQRSARVWRSAAVESRKWRFSYVWMFHAWEQLPRDVAAIIQAAGPHYHLYTTSKGTYQALAEEIKPFSIEEALATPTHWAINIIRAGGKTVTPFMAKMAPPPSFSGRYVKKDKVPL